MGPRLAPALLLACGLAACAHGPRPRTTFEEAGLLAVVDDSGAPMPPPVKVVAPRSIAAEPVDGPPIDGTLLGFASGARARRAARRTGPGFPPEAEAAWRSLAADLDLYLSRPLPQTPLLELVRARITVETEWDLDLRRYGPASPEMAAEVTARAARFANRIAAARALGQGLLAKRKPGRLRWPVEGAGLSSTFGMRDDPFNGDRRMHWGIDLAADAGRVVWAAARGYVVRAGWTAGYGLLVEVRHGGDLTTRYSHLSRVLCGPGDAVEPGQALGLVGATGRATGPHLHFEVWRGGKAQNPLALLGDAEPAPGAAAGGY
ncbi:MAG TPA: M23 family metallopeptidase [Anaeromyxobacteraceae bacterium]|nr:M23 family metallopeptidase [Anaeromyxobacteraceae bacterium]